MGGRLPLRLYQSTLGAHARGQRKTSAPLLNEDLDQMKE